MKFLVGFGYYAGSGSSAVVEGDRDDIYGLMETAVSYGAGDTVEFGDAEKEYIYDYGHEPPYDDEDSEDESIWDYMSSNGYEWFDPPGKFVDMSYVSIEPLPPNAIVGLVEHGSEIKFERYGMNRVRR